MADVLSCLPCESHNAEAAARHPYSFCEDNDTINAVACVYLPSLWGPWESATLLSTSPFTLSTINVTLEITANKCLLDARPRAVSRNHPQTLSTPTIQTGHSWWCLLMGRRVSWLYQRWTVKLWKCFPGEYYYQEMRNESDGQIEKFTTLPTLSSYPQVWVTLPQQHWAPWPYKRAMIYGANG